MTPVTRRQSVKALATALVCAGFRSASAAQAFRFGYAAITWGGNDRQAMADISEIGFRGIQLRTSAVEQYGKRPAELNELLAKQGLAFVALSSGNIGIDPAKADEEMAMHVKHARFLRDCGGLYLQVIDIRPSSVTAEDYGRMARRLNELGKRVADLGLRLGYHHHMGSLGEAPDEVDRILNATDPTAVYLQLDTAHYLQGGGDPVAAIRKYASRILFLHLKDVRNRRPEPGARNQQSFQFVELGQGRADVKGVATALESVGFKGWVVIELDAVTEPGRTAKASAIMNRDYVTRELGLSIGNAG